MSDNPALRIPRTKIVATIGPASSSAAQIDALLDAGINVARVNCAHGGPDALRDKIRSLRERAALKGIPLAVLADLGGPKLRVGRFEKGGVELRKGDEFTLTTADVVGDAAQVSVNHAGLPDDVHVGDDIFLNDGLIRIVVTRIAGAAIATRVEVGGWLSDKKGLSVPAAAISTPSMTDKDWHDLDVVAAAGVDYVGLSFVRSEEDIELLRNGMTTRGVSIPIVAKIEKAHAISRLDAIVHTADAVMVARGDLGVECAIEEVPVLQKRIISACNAAGRPVITATQMLESMVSNPRPTRAEVTDVANAVLDGTDAVMLSEETATGQYPFDAVRMMRRVITTSEAFVERDGRLPRIRVDADSELAIEDAVGRSACLAAGSVRAAAIVCLTRSGATARAVAKWRPPQPVLAVTPQQEALRRLNLVWGVTPILLDIADTNFDAVCAQITEQLRQTGHLAARATVVLTAGLPFGHQCGSNTVRIVTV